MCLPLVDRVRNCTVSGFGYKVFKLSDFANYLFFEFGSYKGSQRVPINKWIKSNRPHRNYEKYAPNFHLFLSLQGARAWASDDEIILKVKYRGAQHTGWQVGHKVIVAKEIYVSYTKKTKKK